MAGGLPRYCSSHVLKACTVRKPPANLFLALPPPCNLRPSPPSPSPPPQAAFDLRPVPARLLPLVPLFCRSLTQMGTSTESFIELTERIGRKTGGISVYPFTSPVRGKEQPVSYILVSGLGGCTGCTGEGRLPRVVQTSTQIRVSPAQPHAPPLSTCLLIHDNTHAPCLLPQTADPRQGRGRQGG